ncbi:type II toxin-antitoxin system Phd/YefM family antitoxin [Cellulosimicrobium cellulans]|uniref:type II toxin-antitoxin system Phd/YefM family antitoxin n=1 Tax=Cellulosimicrobium cellulans TaxID=1710 RepID=UPI003966FBF7
MALDDAAARLAELVHAVEHGDEVTLTRDGRPVARIVAVAGAARRTSGRGTAAGATVAAEVSTTAIQLSPPDESGASPAPEAGAPGDGRHTAGDETVGASAPEAPAAPPASAPDVTPAPAAEEPAPAAPTRVSTRAPEPGAPAPAATDATIVLDPVPAAGPGPDPAADPERPDPPRRRSRRELAAPTEPLGAVRPETDGD